MVKYSGELLTEVREKMRGGEGACTVTTILNEAELYEKGRAFMKITVPPNCSIGYHEHIGDMEVYYIIKGTLILSDNDKEVTLSAGDTLYTPDGSGHSARNESTEEAELIALIIYK